MEYYSSKITRKILSCPEGKIKILPHASLRKRTIMKDPVVYKFLFDKKSKSKLLAEIRSEIIS